MNKHRIDTDLLRFIAIVLITNSHLDLLFPIKEMGVGGSIGNSIFFMLSGYGLWISYNNNKLNMINWYARRVMRIYPTLIIVTILFPVLYNQMWQKWSFDDYFGYMVWPNNYWFISAMMVFYVFVYLILKSEKKSNYFVAAIILFFAYSYFYNQLDLSGFVIEAAGYFKWLFYAGMMLLGCLIAIYKNVILDKIGLISAFLFLFLSLFLYGSVKLLVHKGFYTEAQFLLHLLTFPIVILLFRLLADEKVKSTVLTYRMTPLLVFVGSIALEIYLIQEFVYSHEILLDMIFPFNVLVFWLLVILLAYTVKLITNKVLAVTKIR